MLHEDHIFYEEGLVPGTDIKQPAGMDTVVMEVDPVQAYCDMLIADLRRLHDLFLRHRKYHSSTLAERCDAYRKALQETALHPLEGMCDGMRDQLLTTRQDVLVIRQKIENIQGMMRQAQARQTPG